MKHLDLESNLYLYTHQGIDTDYSSYLIKNSDVYCYKWHNTDLNTIFKRFQARCVDGLYIIGNYLYFTLNGAKYYISLGSFSSEWDCITDLVNEIKNLVQNIAYEPGRLD